MKLNPDTQIVATLGSKEGFANVAQAITAPGDVVLVPDPSYPIHAFGFLMAGGVIRSVPSEPTPDFFPTLERAIAHSIPKPIAVVVCYPSNPTAYVADLDFYKDLVAFAKKHDIFILSDLAYAEVYFDDKPPPSVLQVPGAMDVTVEFTSMSKTFSMPGWRMGFAVGNERIIAALGAGEVLSRLRRLHADPGRGDRGAQRPGRLHPRDARDLQAPPRRAGRKLRPRRLGRAGADGLDVRLGADPGAVPRRSAASNSPSCWSRRPRSRCRPASASASAARAIVRIALVENEQRIRQAARNIRRFLETGAGKVAQRRSARHAALEPSSDRGRIMVAPAQSGSCRSRHGRRRGGAADRAAARSACRALRPADRGRRGQRALARQGSRRRSDEAALGRRSGRACARSRHRRVRRTDGRRRRSGASAAVEAALAAGKSVVTANKALLAQHGVALAQLAEKQRRRAQFRGRGRRRHPDRQDAARRACRQFDQRASTASSTAPAITS